MTSYATPAKPRRARAEPDRRRARWPWALLVILAPYLLGFTLTSYSALRALTGHGGLASLIGWEGLGLVGGTTAVGILVALVLGRSLFALTWTELGLAIPSRRPLWRGLLLCCAAYVLMWVAFLVFNSFPRIGLDASSVSTGSPYSSALQIITYALVAGIGEEILIVAVPVAVMTALRWRWPVQIAVLALLRTPFHLYYGYTAIVLAVVWSVLFWWFYRRYRWVWPLIAAHALYNCVVNANVFGAGALVLRLVGIAVLLVGAAFVVRDVVIRRSRSTAGAAVGA